MITAVQAEAEVDAAIALRNNEILENLNVKVKDGINKAKELGVYYFDIHLSDFIEYEALYRNGYVVHPNDLTKDTFKAGEYQATFYLSEEADN
ncbi:MAG: hypothetical protein MJ245_01460 [Clostridia bacterium]|nr:hypothetical protein [Clostridia bacterium]